ncbi:MAG TPA: ATP-binding cassette domain-containing protein [Candidatus Angelobacter sp.]|nr:ATP-binding cassette domain-containing protein [Candidatus Angelobacter sp.]
MTSAATDAAIHAEGLVKHFGDVRAVDGLDLTVPFGTVVGLLGPNGAGKTTTVRILTTLLAADAGRATVAGLDVAEQPDAVRRVIGLTGQYAAVDEYLTGRENLDMVGRLYHLPPAYVRQRADELLERFELSEAADRPAKTYSGGMRRRLDLSASLVGRPRILFLDEPTTGLDPRSRLQMWEVIADLVADGTTVLLTTQYLEEADQLAQDIVVIDHGTVIAHGTSDVLKTQVGGDRLEIVVHAGSDLDVAVGALHAVSDGEATVDVVTRRVTAPVSGGSTVLVDAVRVLDQAGVAIDDLALRRPTLDDVFLALTGHAAEDPVPSPATKGRRRGRKEA